MKLWRWLRSRPLARVRRTIATRRRVTSLPFSDWLAAQSPDMLRQYQDEAVFLPPSGTESGVVPCSHEDISLDYGLHLMKQRGGLFSRDRTMFAWLEDEAEGWPQ